MASVNPEIKPNGLNQRQLVDLAYMIVYSIYGICTQLDEDNVSDDTYEDDSYTAIFNGDIQDSRGNRIINYANVAGTSTTDDRFFVMTPDGMSDNALNEFLYQVLDMLETLTEQIDADDATTSTYEALCYTAVILHMVENCKGSTLGNGKTYYFRPGGNYDQANLVDLLYEIVYSLSLLTAKLDTDAKPAGSDYADNWYTATILMRIENSKGSVLGNDPTWAH